MGILYLVGTPIGNLGDFSPRAIQILEQVDFIAMEDTRVTRKLLTHFGISTAMVSYHQHNSAYATQKIIARLLAGEDAALVSDAGMPAISDPGEELVRACGEHGIEVVVVPGPSALIAALAVSGLSTKRFSFEGFLSVTNSKRKEHLQSLLNDRRTLVFYEAPHKLIDTLADFLTLFGNRKISICRELTKQFEEVLRFTVEEAVEYYRTTKPRGEFVLVLEGATPTEESLTLEGAVALVQQRMKEELSPAQAAKEVASMTSYKKNELYRLALDIE